MFEFRKSNRLGCINLREIISEFNTTYKIIWDAQENKFLGMSPKSHHKSQMQEGIFLMAPPGNLRQKDKN